MWYCSESLWNSYFPSMKRGASGSFAARCDSSELLSASMEKLLSAIHFTGRVSVVVQNGRVLKSGYEEGYFRNNERL